MAFMVLFFPKWSCCSTMCLLFFLRWLPYVSTVALPFSSYFLLIVSYPFPIDENSKLICSSYAIVSMLRLDWS